MKQVIDKLFDHSETRFPYHPRAQICGTICWLCPRCGRINKSHVTYRHWQVRCTSAQCRQRYVIGIRFLVPDPGYHKPRPRLMAEDYLFPLCALGEWDSGQPAHCVEEESLGDAPGATPLPLR